MLYSNVQNLASEGRGGEGKTCLMHVLLHVVKLGFEEILLFRYKKI